MTIREMQYAIQGAIDDGTNEVTDDCILAAKLDDHGKWEFFAVVPGRDENGLNPTLDKWVKLEE